MSKKEEERRDKQSKGLAVPGKTKFF